jgi:hypothetical protein
MDKTFELHGLSQKWLAAKTAEKTAQDERREIEDQMLALIDLPADFEGSQNTRAGFFKINLTGRMNHKIDSEKLQMVAAEHGLTEHLSGLFRWKPEINARAWKAAEESIIAPLLEAITTTPGRPSFAITVNEEK